MPPLECTVAGGAEAHAPKIILAPLQPRLFGINRPQVNIKHSTFYSRARRMGQSTKKLVSSA